VLVSWGTFTEDPAPYGPSRPPDLLLYADGRLVRRTDRGLQEARLSRGEVCALLNAIEAAGFFDYEEAAYQQALAALPLGLVSTTRLRVEAWRARRASLEGLREALDDGTVAAQVPPGLAATYRLLAGYQPAQLATYRFQQLAVTLYQYPPDAAPEAAAWPLADPTLQSLYDSATLPNRTEGVAVLLEGQRATRVHAALQAAERRRFAEGGETYAVSARPLLPYESLESAAGYAARIPSPGVAVTATTWTCSAADGTGLLP
jgi:hypothetical protein